MRSSPSSMLPAPPRRGHASCPRALAGSSGSISSSTRRVERTSPDRTMRISRCSSRASSPVAVSPSRPSRRIGARPHIVNGVAAGEDGSAYVAGQTFSTNFPYTGGALVAAPSGAFVAKFDTDAVPPTITVTTPPAGATYATGEAATVDFSSRTRPRSSPARRRSTALRSRTATLYPLGRPAGTCSSSPRATEAATSAPPQWRTPSQAERTPRAGI